MMLYEWRTKLLTTRTGHSQSGWSPIGCECFRTNLNIPSPLPTTLVFRIFCRLLICSYIIRYAFKIYKYIPVKYFKIL